MILYAVISLQKEKGPTAPSLASRVLWDHGQNHDYYIRLRTSPQGGYWCFWLRAVRTPIYILYAKECSVIGILVLESAKRKAERGKVWWSAGSDVRTAIAITMNFLTALFPINTTKQRWLPVCYPSGRPGFWGLPILQYHGSLASMVSRKSAAYRGIPADSRISDIESGRGTPVYFRLTA